MAKDINNILIPNVSKTPGQSKVDVSNKLGKGQNPGEFSKLLNDQLSGMPEHHGLKLSTHAIKRINERN